MIVSRWLILTFFLSLFSVISPGQSLDLKFEHLTSEDGLPQNGTFGITKDKFGFMWFGTWSGLCRYDGYRFKIYRYQPGNERSLISSRVMNIVKDNDQNLWIQTHNDSIICRYNYITDDFDRIKSRSLSKDLLGRLNWISHRAFLKVKYKDYEWRIDSRSDCLFQTYLPSGQIKQYTSNPVNRWSLNDSFVTDVYLDDQQILWVATYSDGINKANVDAKPFHYYFHNPGDPRSIIDNHVRAITKDKLGNLWVGTRAKGLTVISSKGAYRHMFYQKQDASSVTNDHIKMLYCDSRGDVWIGTLHGLDRFTPSSGRMKHFVTAGLNNAAVFAATEDHKHNMWFATWSGIYEYIPLRDSVVHYNTDRELRSSNVMTILEDRSHRIWAGTEGGGISVFHYPTTGKLALDRYFGHDDGSQISLSDERIYSVYEDDKGIIWIGTGNGLDRYDPRANSIKYFYASPEGLTSATIAAVNEDHNGFIWVSHKKGISQIDKRTFTIRNYSTQDGLQSNEFSDNAVFHEPTNGMLYFGGNNGVNDFYPDSIKSDHTLPKVVLTELQVLNKPVSVNDKINGRIVLTKPLYLTPEIELNYKDKSIAIEFAGLHYANPSGNKYAFMLEGFDKTWVYTNASNRIASYSNLERGTYVFKVKASNSDGVWNPIPTTLKIVVLPPWWTSNSAFLIYIVLIGLILYGVFYYFRRYDRLKTKLNYETILHEKELELRQSKIEFFTNISHEIKTPLSLILAPVERIMAGGLDKAMLTSQVRTMKENGDRLLRLINQLLDIRRFESGDHILHMEEDDLVAFTERTVDAFSELAFERHIFLQFNSSQKSFRTAFDHDKLEKVLSNLLSNAFKFAENGGHIDVSLEPVTKDLREWVAIQVRDDGVGIPEEDFERIFKPFQQGAANKKGGTGLGLAYVKALVEMHGGWIDVMSTQAKEKSTSFTVWLPHTEIKHAGVATLENKVGDLADIILADSDLGGEIIDSSPQSRASSKLPLLLLVEDNVDLRNYLSAYFRTDYNVLEAANGADGFAIAVERTPDVIITDMMMPEMNGTQLCEKLKSNLITNHIPVIMLTARSTIESQIEGIEHGADDYITKPFNLRLISLKVKVLLDARSKMREKYRTNISLSPSTTMPVSPDEKLLKNVLEFVESKIGDTKLSIDDIGDTIGLSSSQLYRKMKALTGLSTVDLIKQIRLKRAQDLLLEKKFNINEIAYMVGFTDTDYFRKCFKAQFGKSPSEFVRQEQQGR